MCEIVSKEVKKGHWDIRCKITGKPITVSNDNGMYCEERCDEDLDIAAGKVLKKMIKTFNKMFK